MDNNPYDQPSLFQKYSEMERSQKGLAGAGEWNALQQVLPDFKGKSVLDLGCGYGWHCLYAAENGASNVIGVDQSLKMLDVAKSKSTKHTSIQYVHSSIEDIQLERESFDVVLSSLALHYVPSFNDVAQKVHNALTCKGQFIFSVEHPTFTAEGSQDCLYESRTVQHFPIDRYFEEGRRETNFLGETVMKYHKTLTTYLNGLLINGWVLNRVIEPSPPASMLVDVQMQHELRRPMMLIVAATKQ
ncbi:LOW QUALITY PROTEIN: methyltransferase, UbiE/COQ5 family [Geomicrobium sp. JCM 19055]|nr:LOW QUALITY PROTEIN: methyltransferase, UbiE/COQ5 family [Geomicrobium sp. JCM 19055]